MVFSWYIKQIVKKKFSATFQDKKDWIAFTKESEKIYDKDANLGYKSLNQKIVYKLDLHGNSLNDANKKVKQFINQSFERGCRKILIITGKGLRSKTYNDVYRSEKMSVLKNSVPEYIKNNENLSNKISKMEIASVKDGGVGAFYVFLKNKIKLKE